MADSKPTTVSSKEILTQIKKDHGANIASQGGADYEQMERLPTGVFPIDLATGGGFPMGKSSIVYGPESSNKTNLILKSIIEGQIKYPDRVAVMIEPEHALDKGWARKMGVDLDRLIVAQPESAEQAVDFVESFCYGKDVFAVYLDSIAALTTTNEIDSEAGKQIVGGASLLTGKMYRKVNVALSKMTNSGQQAPAFIAINQIRHKIGVMFGNPETMPGGNMPKFASSMTIRVYGKNVVDKKINPAMPLFKEVSAVLQKWKCPILAVNAIYKMQMLQADGRGPGYVDDWNTVCAYMKELDYLSKSPTGGWLMSGEKYPTLKAVEDTLYHPDNIQFLQSMKVAIIAELLDAGAIAPTVDDGPPPDEEEE